MAECTIIDIAREAGVSITTVSRVLNHSNAVKPATTEKVNEVIRRLNYSPNVMARSLSMQKSSTIGVVVPQIDNPFFGAALRGITDIAEKNNYAVMCFNTDDDYKKDLHAIELMKENRIAGLLFTPAVAYDSDEQRKKILSQLEVLACPVICVDRCIMNCTMDEVVFDDESAVYEAVSELVKAGHTKIAIITGDRDSYLGRVRFSGYQRALSEHGIPLREEYIFTGNLRREMGYRDAMAMLALKDRPGAVMLCNNEITAGFLQAARETGLRLPEDMEFVGLDRIEMLELTGIPSNYIERDAAVLGRAAMEMLLSRIKNPGAPKERRQLKPVVNCSSLLHPSGSGS